MLGADRQARMLRLIQQRSSMTVGEFAQQFGVSPMTVRRDLDALEREGLVVRVHGGVMAAETPVGAREEERAALHTAEKAAIGRAAARLVEDGQTIFIDAGTTTIELAYGLRDRRGLTVVTNSIRVLSALADSPGINLIGLGGSVYEGAWSFVGPLAEHALRKFNASTAFLGITSVSAERGLTEVNFFEASVKSLFIQQAQRVICLADSSKLERVSPVVVAPLKDVDMVITDDRLPPRLAEAYQKAGVAIILASGTGASIDLVADWRDSYGSR